MQVKFTKNLPNDVRIIGMKAILNMPKKAALFTIRVYQKFFSFDHSFWARPEVYRACIHYPSCSEYTYEAIERHNIIKGTVMGFFRILRCNPISGGGYDPVPKHFSIRHNHENEKRAKEE